MRNPQTKQEAAVRRWFAVTALATLLSLAACTDDDQQPAPAPSAEPEADDPAEASVPTGLRVGVVLPARDRAAADEIDTTELDLDRLPPELRDEVAELRAVVPDAQAFVSDIATLLITDGYDVVCVLGAQAGEIAAELAARHAATEVCAAPAMPDDEAPDNLLLVDIALAELGHVVGVTLSQLGDEDPVALLMAGERAGGQVFRAGLRTGLGNTPLRQAREDLEQLDYLEEELAEALGDGVAAVALDGGPQTAPLLEEALDEVPVLAPAPLLTEENPGVLRWRVRWEVVLEAVLAHIVADDTPLPEELGLASEVFAFDHGPQADDELVAHVEEVLGELERGERDPLEHLDDDNDEDDNDDDGDDDQGQAGGSGLMPPE